MKKIRKYQKILNYPPLKIITLLFLLSLSCGCVNEKIEYVCADGNKVSSIDMCPKYEIPTVPVCNKPYLLVGTDCCLDQNDNKICDSDESTTTTTFLFTATTSTTTFSTYTTSTVTSTTTLYALNFTSFQEEKVDYSNIQGMISINGKIAYIATDENNRKFVVYDGKEIGNNYEYVWFLEEINGKLAYSASKDHQSFMVYDGKESDRYDDVGPAVWVNGSIVFKANRDGKIYIVYAK